MAALPLKSSDMERPPLFVFLWAKGHNANAIHSEMRPVYGDKWSDEENGQKFASILEVQWAVCHWLAQQPTFFFASGIHQVIER